MSKFDMMITTYVDADADIRPLCDDDLNIRIRPAGRVFDDTCRCGSPLDDIGNDEFYCPKCDKILRRE